MLEPNLVKKRIGTGNWVVVMEPSRLQVKLSEINEIKDKTTTHAHTI
jgi:hypothetical protein